MKPLCVELFAGLHGWGEAFVRAGFRVVGFDIMDMCVALGYRRPAGIELVLQDVLTLHGSQFREAACIVASPPCQAFSYAAMPWKIAKAEKPDVLPEWWHKPEPKMSEAELAEWKAWKAAHPAKPPSTALFDACFRIQREASEAAGRYIPMVVENVKGAQPWVGPARAHFGSFYLWGDVAQVGGRIVRADGPVRFGVDGLNGCTRKFNPDGTNHGQGSWFAIADSKNRGSRKVPGMNFHDHEKTGKPGRSFQSAAVKTATGGSWFGGYHAGQEQPNNYASGSPARKAASALIAKIPSPLAEHVTKCFWPQETK